MSEDFRPDENHLTLLYWIARAVDMWGREGFEEGQSAEEMRRELRHVLLNFGFPYPPDPDEADNLVVWLLERGPVYEPRPPDIPEGFELPKAVRAFEADFIAEALRREDGHITRAAALLGINHQTLNSALEGRHKDLLSLRIPARTRPGVWGKERRRRETEKRRARKS